MTDQSIPKARTAGVEGAEVTVETTGLTIERLYTHAGRPPLRRVEWERRDVVQTNWKTDEVVFEQRGVGSRRSGPSTPRPS